MGFLIANWYIGVAVVAVLLVLGLAVYVFVKLPTSKQLDKIREWMLLAVVRAEMELGAQTGRLKLQFVYDLFITRFVWIARVISYKMFESLVDEALDAMRIMLLTNKAVSELVYPESTQKAN